VHDVVVVGGGMAGLAAAWALRDLDVVVLEASDRVGGRVRSERRGAYWLNFGAHVFAGPGSETDRLLRETGVEARDVPGALAGIEFDGRVVSGGRVETYPFRLPLPLRSRAALVRAGARIRLGVARMGDPMTYENERTFAAWLGRVPDDVDALLRPTLQRSSGEPEDLAAGYGIGYFQLVWDRSGGLARNIIGGPATLAEALAAQLDVRLNTPVHEVVRDRDGVRVDDMRARAAILATPAHATHALAPGLPDDTRDALRQIPYGSYVVAAFLTNEQGPMPWDDVYAVAAARRSFNLFFNMANVLRGGERADGGSLMVYSGAGLARRLWDEDDARIRDIYVADIDAMFPGAPDVVDQVVVHRWEKGLPYVCPGRAKLQPALERPFGPFFLAGDYLGVRYTETAIATGVAAAAAARDRLR
jgi:oxygen-dependent protoporphyrinogen oxidase